MPAAALAGQARFLPGGIVAQKLRANPFCAAAIVADARDNISPRARLEYYPGCYAADILDPDGYSVEVVHKS